MNKALMAKLAWRVLTQKEETWCEVFRSKYGIVSDGMMEFKCRQRASSIWKGLMWGYELLHKGLRWEVTNGRRINF